MTFTPEFLDDLRARVPLAAEIGRRVPLKKRGREFIGLCPFHNEKTPSFTVNEAKGFFHCFGCGAHGDVIGFVMRWETLSFPEAVARLVGQTGADANLRPTVKVGEAAGRRAENDVGQPPRNVMRARRIWSEARPARGTLAEVYLHSRGLDMKIPPAIRFHGHLWHDLERRSFPALVAAVSPPAWIRSAITGVWRIYLAPDGKNKARVDNPKLGLGRVRGCAVWLTEGVERLAVTEGIETGLAIVQAVPALAVCSALSTGNMTVFEPPPWAREIIFCADADPAGLTTAAEAAKTCKARGLKSVVAVPPKIMADFNDVLTGTG